MPARSPQPAVPKIVLNRVTVQPGHDPVVRHLDLEIETGRVFWIVGPNGAGKTRLLRVLAGLDRPRAGTVRREAPVGTAFRYYHAEMALPGWSTVGSWDRLTRSLLIPEATPPTALWPDVDPARRVRRLSTGERKRLLLDSLLRAPGGLLLDEPYAHLSPGARAALTRILDERAADAVVVVATNQATDRALQDGGLRLEGGTATPLVPAAGEYDR